MIKFLSDYIFKDFIWKLAALMAAVLLWFVVLNIEDPLQKRIISKQIEAANIEALDKNNFILLSTDKTQNVKLNVQCKRSDMSKIYNQTPIIRATYDLSKIDESYNNWLGDPISLPIDLEYPTQTYAVLSKDPESVKIMIDKRAAESRDIVVSVKGKAADGFQAMQPEFDSVVIVSGTKTTLDRLETVRAEVDVSGAEKEVVKDYVELRGYDSENKDITDLFSFNIYGIDVAVPVYPVKTVPIKARMGGTPKQGYYVSEVIVSPETVDLVGPADELTDISAIDLSPVQLNGVSSDKSWDYKIWDYLSNTNVTIKSDSVSNVVVTVVVEPESVRNIKFPTGNISTIRDDNTMVVQMPKDPINVALRGPLDVLEEIKPDDLQAVLDLSGLSTGIHDVELSFTTLPQKVQVSGKPASLRVVINEDASFATVVTAVNTEELPEQ